MQALDLRPIYIPAGPRLRLYAERRAGLSTVELHRPYMLPELEVAL